jgi:hypothetical protein
MLVAILYGINHTYPFFMLAAVQIAVTIVGGLVLWIVERRTDQELAQQDERAATPVAAEALNASSGPPLEVAAK